MRPRRTPQTRHEVWDQHHRRLTLGLLATVVFTAFEALAVATALPATVADIGGLHLYGWTFSAFMLSSLVGITWSGPLADQHGPARPFVGGAVLFVTGLLTAGAVTNMPSLVAARVIQGLGSGAIGAIAYVAVARGYSAEARPRMLALLSSAWVVPGLVGPAIAGLITDTIGWRWVFWALAPATAVGVAIAVPSLRRLGVPQRSVSTPTDTRTRDALLLSIGAGLLLAGLEETVGGWLIPLVTLGVALGVPPLRRLLPLGTLRARPGIGAAVALMGLTGFTFFGAEAFVPLAIDSVRGQSATVAGLPLTVGTLSWSAGAWVQARESPRRSRRVLVFWGFGLIAVGIAATSMIVHPAVPVAAAGLSWGLTSLGMGLAYSTLALVIIECATQGEEGRASASLQLANTLGIALGTGFGGGLLAWSSGWGQTLATGIVLVDLLMVAMAVLALALTSRLPSRPPVPPFPDKPT